MSNDSKKIAHYPFTTKAQIKARLASDPAFVTLCLAVLLDRHVNLETRGAGFMSSQAKVGLALATKSLSEELSAEEMVQATNLTSSYCKQLASHFRKLDVASDPDLAEAARVFSAN
jgi:hypothetical protein